MYLKFLNISLNLNTIIQNLLGSCKDPTKLGLDLGMVVGGMKGD